MAPPLISRLAEWIADLRYEDLPPRVVELCRDQVGSVLGAALAADRLPTVRRYRRSLTALHPGSAVVPPFSERCETTAACGLAAAQSVALDYDDYLFLAHTGHSAVGVSLTLGAARQLTAQQAVPAQAVANELGGRLGASVVLGPHNGQLWVFIQAAGAAAAAARLLNLDAERTAHALALALAAPPYPFFSSLMQSDAKMHIVAEATAAGVRAAQLAAAGHSGPLAVLDEDQGFYRGFSSAPGRFYLEGLGQSWVSLSLAFKPYPGCAYVDTMVDALLDILAAFAKERGRPPAAEEIASVTVEASLLSIQMEELGARFAAPGELPPVFNLAFRLPHNAALTLLAGRLTGAELSPEFLSANREAILGIAAKVRVVHDWRLSLAVIRALADGLAPFSPLGRMRLRQLRQALREARQNISGALPFDFTNLRRLLGVIDFREALRLYRQTRRSTGDFGAVDFRRFRLPFGARVTVKTSDGREYQAERDIPDGAPGGRRHRRQVVAEKLRREAAACLGDEQTASLLSLIQQGADPARLLEALAPARSL